MDFVEICNVCAKKVIIKAAKRIFNSGEICRSYCDFYFGVTFFGTHCIACENYPLYYVKSHFGPILDCTKVHIHRIAIILLSVQNFYPKFNFPVSGFL